MKWILLAALALMLSGCATRGYVDREVLLMKLRQSERDIYILEQIKFIMEKIK